MNEKPARGWRKHADFIILDILCLQVSFALAYWILRGTGNPYAIYGYKYLASVFAFSQMLTIVFTNDYSGVLRRGYFKELASVFRCVLNILIISLVVLFLLHGSAIVSRLQFGLTLLIFIVLDYSLRIVNKRRVKNNGNDGLSRKGKSLVVVTTGALADEAISRLTELGTPIDYFIAGIILLDGDKSKVKGDYGDLPIIPFDEAAVERIRRKWVDEVFILQPSTELIDRDLLNDLTDMGITVHFTIALLNDDDWPPVQMRKLGQYKVFTSSINFITNSQARIKRITDILGGIAGCFITGILFIFVAPAIYAKSPGPIFFTQDRVGMNGKVFKMYKFRSMYLDAEERKAALMEQNKLDSNLMFKMDDDPRIIGSEKKDKNGKPKGIGNFIRNTSIDEWPQFFNVIKGDMSLVGNSLVLGVT